MFFLLSGEGPTDIGSGLHQGLCCGEEFHHGPMAAIVDRIVEKAQNYSILDYVACGFVSESHLAGRAGDLRAAKKSLGLPGKKRAKETRYYFNTARVLARIAMEQEVERDDSVVPILFRDTDDTASAGRGTWPQKWQSMLDGFGEENFHRGVPMIPKPKSEAWLLCATKANPYVGCEALEEESGNDKSPNNLKKQFVESIGIKPDREQMVKMVADGTVDIDRIQMPSFSAFRGRLESVI